MSFEFLNERFFFVCVFSLAFSFAQVSTSLSLCCGLIKFQFFFTLGITVNREERRNPRNLTRNFLQIWRRCRLIEEDDERRKEESEEESSRI